MRQGPAALHQLIFAALRQSKNLAGEPDNFLQRALAECEYVEEDLRPAVNAVYREAYYSFAKDLHIDERENRTIQQLVRLLDIDDEREVGLNYQVGLAIYKKRFREAVADGALTDEEDQQLHHISQFFQLTRTDIKSAIADQALAYYSSRLVDATKDGVISDKEMEELALLVRRFGLTKQQLSEIDIPQKKEVLTAALQAIKATGQIDESDREHMRTLAQFLNAKDLLKFCLMDLDLYERIFQIRDGQLPSVDPGTLILDPGEKLHIAMPIIYERQMSGKIKSSRGTLYVGGYKMRFVGLRQSHEIRYASLIQAEFVNRKTPKIHLAVSNGKGGGDYRLAKKGDAGLLVELLECISFLIRKSRGLERAGERDSRYIPSEVRSEVWYRDSGCCVMCGADSYLEFDHIIPWSKGGATSVDNLQLLCRSCNSTKSDRI